jgi:hypothetical protein
MVTSTNQENEELSPEVKALLQEFEKQPIANQSTTKPKTQLTSDAIGEKLPETDDIDSGMLEHLKDANKTLNFNHGLDVYKINNTPNRFIPEKSITDKFLEDPRTYGTVVGGVGSLASQYKESKTPKKITLEPTKIIAEPVTGKPIPIYDEAAGSRALTSNQGLNKGVAASESLAELRFREFLKNNPDYFKMTGNPMLTNPAGEMGPSVFNGTIFEPLSTTRQIANEAAQAAHAPVAPLPQSPLSMGDKLLKAFPNAPKVVEAVKGALPVVGKTLNAAGAGFNIADVINRMVDKDYAGAGISGVGGGLAMLASAPVGIPIGLTTALIQYYHDHPELANAIKKDFGKMASGNKPAPTSSQFQANPMGDY